MSQLLSADLPIIVKRSSDGFSGYSEYSQYYDSITLKVQGSSSAVSTTYRQTSSGIQISTPQVSVLGNLSVSGRISIPGYGTIQPGVAFTNDYNSLLNKPDLLGYGKLASPNNWSATNIFSTLQTTIRASSQYDVVNYETLNNIFNTENSWTQKQSFLYGSVESSPVNDTDIANKRYVDSQIGGGSGITRIESNGSLLPSTVPGSRAYTVIINPANTNRWSAPQIFDSTSTFNSNTVFNSPNNYFLNAVFDTSVNIGTSNSKVIISSGLGDNQLYISAYNPNFSNYSYIGGNNSGIIINPKSNSRPLLNYNGTTFPNISSGIATLSDITSATSNLLSANNSWTGQNTFNSTVKVPTISGTTDSSINAASTAFVQGVGNLCGKLSANNTWTELNNFTVSPTIPTPVVTDTTTKAANMAAINNAFNNFKQDGVGAVTQPYLKKVREVVSVQDFGAVGDGVTNDTTPIQNALNASVGKLLLLGINQTYAITTLTVPKGVTIVANNSKFRRNVSSVASAAIYIQGDFIIDNLLYTSPSGDTGDKAIKITGSNVNINYLSCIGDSDSSISSSTNWALEIGSIPSGTELRNIIINSFYCFNYKTAAVINYCANIAISNARVTYFRTAFYLRDVTNSTFSNFQINLTSQSANGSPGENGLLLESTISHNSLSDLTFTRWTVTNSGEHAFRLGGQLSIRNIWFNDCRAYKPGSAIVINNPSSTEWHGGCGFKVLGPDSLVGVYHSNIWFNDCIVQDIQDTYGEYPAGHGINNFSGFLVACAEDVHMNNCVVNNRQQSLSSGHAIYIAASKNIFINGGLYANAYSSQILIGDEAYIPGYPGLDQGNDGIYINGIAVSEFTNNSGYVIQFSALRNTTKNVRITACDIQGGNVAIRLDPPTAGGGYQNIVADFTYSNSLANDITHTIPVVSGSTAIMATVTAPWRPAAYNAPILAGSTYTDTTNNLLLARSSTGWKTLN